MENLMRMMDNNYLDLFTKREKRSVMTERTLNKIVIKKTDKEGLVKIIKNVWDRRPKVKKHEAYYLNEKRMENFSYCVPIDYDFIVK